MPVSAASKTESPLTIPRTLSRSEIEVYEREGYLAVGKVLTPAGLEAIREQCMTAWVKEKEAFREDKSWLENTLLPNVHHRSKAVREYYFNGPMVDVATQVVSPNIKAATSQLTFKLQGNTKPVQWHQDNGYGQLSPTNSISCLTALDDTDESNGCLWIIPGSHKLGQMQHGQGKESSTGNFRAEQTMDVDESKAIPIHMKAGECLFFHGWTLHKSEGNFAPRDRRILFFRYADADAVETDKGNKPRLGRLLRGTTKFEEVRQFEADL
jgi:ectoine hydroxylase-related dioxygenase (phytanoyl-CoA dioxygenase family)